MARSSVIVTGSSGLIGSALVARLVADYDVFGLDVAPPDEPPPAGFAHLEIDLTDDQSVHQAVRRVAGAESGPLASVVHLAAYYDFSGEPSPLYEQVTVAGTRRLLREVQGLAPEQFVFSSTMLVHAPKEPGEMVREDDPLEGRWDYPQSKIDTEELLRREHGEVPVVLMRIAGVYTDEGDSIPIAHQIQRIFERRITARVYPGDVDRGQAFVHLDDLIDALTRVVDLRRELPPEVVPILVGEPETPSYDQLQKEIARLLHGDEEWTTRHIPKPVAKSGAWIQGKVPGIEEPFIKPWMVDMADDHYELDISRARDLLAWQPRHRLLKALPSMIANLRRDPRGWYERHGLEGDPPAE